MLVTGDMFYQPAVPSTGSWISYRACHWFHVFPRLPLVTCLPALAIGYMFSCACCWWHIFPPLPLVTYCTALVIGYMFSRACHWSHVFPRLPLVTCFPALVIGYMFSRACHWSHVVPCYIILQSLRKLLSVRIRSLLSCYLFLFSFTSRHLMLPELRSFPRKRNENLLINWN